MIEHYFTDIASKLGLKPACYGDWTAFQRQSFLKQVRKLDLKMLQQQRELLKREPVKREIKPLPSWDIAGKTTDRLIGCSLIEKGRTGCLVVAGGEGSRLGSSHPKGMFAVTLVRKKTLFQLLAERVLSAGLQARCKLPLAIMTAPSNHLTIEKFFKENSYFGLDPSQVSFFMQGTLPYLGDEGELICKNAGELAMGPSGNGCALHHFYQSGIWQQWRSRGVDSLLFIQIDNPLADPFDAELLGYRWRQGRDVVIKAIMRESAEEKVGVIVSKEGRTAVVEYSERIDQKIDLEENSLYLLANISNFCFSMDFIQRVASLSLPLHLARKPVDGAFAWKFEYFIFDVLDYTDQVATIVYPRELCYAPLKNRSGLNSLAHVQRALHSFDRYTFQKISKTALPNRPFELSTQFYYPTKSLLKRWEGVLLPNISYIEDLF